MEEVHYWGYRIENSNADFFYKELTEKKQLRQGWGYNENQNLEKKEEITDSGARRNIPIYEKVKKGDYLLIPHIPTWDSITIARATEDFDKGYRFEIHKEKDDFGHIFPAEYVKEFTKRNINVGADIKSTFKCISRFWNMDQCGDSIEKIISLENIDVKDASTFKQGWTKVVADSFEEEKFAGKVYESLKEKYNAAEWEFVLSEGFRAMFPDNVSVETTGNITEKKHGCDIIIKIPGVYEMTYVIAIQIKDYTGTVSEDVVKQINKVDEYYKDDSGVKVIDKYIIITKANGEDNKNLITAAKESGVKIIFQKELMALLTQMAKCQIGESTRIYDF